MSSTVLFRRFLCGFGGKSAVRNFTVHVRSNTVLAKESSRNSIIETGLLKNSVSEKLVCGSLGRSHTTAIFKISGRSFSTTDSSGGQKPKNESAQDVTQGALKWFSPKLQYGFIVPDDNSPEVFVHVREMYIEGGWKLEPGQKVEYKLKVDEGGRRYASQVTAPEGTMIVGEWFNVKEGRNSRENDNNRRSKYSRRRNNEQRRGPSENSPENSEAAYGEKSEPTA